jgi:CheY-like chemotaxis protein
VDRDELERVLRHVGAPHSPDQRIMIVEDDETARNMIDHFISKAGWTTLLAANGVQALEKLQAEARLPDAIIVDLMMPEMDGFTFIDKLRSHEGWRQIPSIVLTAKELTADERTSLNASVKRVFQKGSYNRRDLLDELRRQLSEAILRSAAS